MENTWTKDSYGDFWYVLTSGRSVFWVKMLTAFSNQNLFHKLLGNGHNFTILTGGHWAHNDYIEILCTYGVVGLICYLKAVFNVFNRILHKANVTVIAWVISIFIWAFNAFFNMFYTYLCAELALPFMLLALRYALQERYPNAGIMVGISDVYLPEVDIKKIVEKRSRKNKAEKVVFGTAGSTSLPRKGHKYVIKALGILKREGITNIEYHMAGGGDEADIIKQAKKENVLEMIHFDGTIPASEMSTFYDNIDVYICSSMAEGLCRSVVEAMGRGCGVICTRVCGNVELADKEFLYEKKDFGTLAKLMKKMMDRKVLSEQMLLSLSKSKNYEKNVLDTKRDEFYLDAINSILSSLN